MDANNPYAAPQSAVEDLGRYSGADLEARKASRAQRLGGALLDGLAFIVCLLPMLIGFAVLGANRSVGTGANVVGVVCGGLSILMVLALLIFNCMWISNNGQTIGKRMNGTKVVRTDGSAISLGRYIGLRVLVIRLFGQVPVVGPLASLIDCLLIFGAERRCLHDIFADTIVIVND